MFFSKPPPSHLRRVAEFPGRVQCAMAVLFNLLYQLKTFRPGKILRNGSWLFRKPGSGPVGADQTDVVLDASSQALPHRCRFATDASPARERRSRSARHTGRQRCLLRMRGRRQTEAINDILVRAPGQPVCCALLRPFHEFDL